MLVYVKEINGVKHLYGTLADYPADTDQPIVYKDSTGTVVTPTFLDKFIDGGSAEAVQRVKDVALDKNISLYIVGKDDPIIGDKPLVVARKSKKKKEE